MFGWLLKPKEEARPAATDSADRLIAEGNRAEDDGQLARACELYRQALALAPRYAKAHSLSAFAELRSFAAGASDLESSLLKAHQHAQILE